MTSDFIERVVTMLENNVAARSSELLGEEDAATAKALRLIGPTIFAGLVMEGTSTEGASRLLDMIRSSPFSTGLGDDLLGVIKHRQARTGAQQRESLCVRLFKDHLDPLVHAISDASGVTSASAEHLLEISIVVSCSVLRARALDDGSSAVHLARILGRQRGDVGERLDAHIAQAIEYALPSSRQADIDEATHPAPIVEYRPRPEPVRAATSAPITSPRPGQERQAPRRPTIEGMLRTDRQPPRAVSTFEGIFDSSGSDGTVAGTPNQTPPPPDLPAMPPGDDVPLTFELAAIDEANAADAIATDAADADSGNKSGRSESRKRAAPKSPSKRDDKFGWEAVSSDDTRKATPSTPRAKTSSKPSIIELFQQRLGTPGLPIAPQFLSAARRDEIAKGARALLAGVNAPGSRTAKPAPPIEQTPVIGDASALSEPSMPPQESPQSSAERHPVASGNEHKGKRRRKGKRALDIGGVDESSNTPRATLDQSTAETPAISNEAFVEPAIPVDPSVEETPVAALPADAGDPPPADDAPAAAAEIAPNTVANVAMPDSDAAVEDLPPASAPVDVEAHADARTEVADRAFDQAPDAINGHEEAFVGEPDPAHIGEPPLKIPAATVTAQPGNTFEHPIAEFGIVDAAMDNAIGDQVVGDPNDDALDTAATRGEQPFQDEPPPATNARGATADWPFPIDVLERKLVTQSIPDRTSATSDWPFTSLSAHAFIPINSPRDETLPVVETPDPPAPTHDSDWGWRERLPGAIPADSLVFPELTRSVALHAGGSSSINENPTQSPHIVSEEAVSRMSGGGVLSTVVPFHAPKPPGGKSISRWWLAPTLVVAVVVSLFIFDYRAALEKRGAIAPSGTLPAEAERPAAAAPTIGPRKTIDLPGGKQLEARANGAIANLVTYLSEPGAAPGRAFVLDEVVFERDTSILTAVSEEQMRQVAQIMQAFPRTKARIESHMEASGDTTGSRLITAERAATVKAALILLGIEDARLESRGMAAERPIASGDSPDDKAKNRRIELILTSR
ncbi:MAG: OmpA family protein [Burkholderiales bacterium]